jgi:hypothetical protein
MPKPIEWDADKNLWLKLNRGVCFEDVIDVLETDGYIDRIHNEGKGHEHQWKFIIEIKGYIYAVPFVEDDVKIFLKTLYASRLYTKKYLQK